MGNVAHWAEQLRSYLMAKGLYKYIVGITAEDVEDWTSMELPDGVSLTADECAEIGAKQNKDKGSPGIHLVL